MDYKNTLLLPKTDFEMRGNLPQKEPNIQKFWKEEDINNKILASNNKDNAFYLHDGPPYANGNMHTGHALNKILKDFVVRYKNMSGFYAPLIHGWDTHGMPIEVALQKKGLSVKNLSIPEFREKCKEFALNQVNIQREQIRRLGILGELDKPYLTLKKEFEEHQIRVFAKMALEGYIYKGLKTVYWSPSSQTALAEAEIEYYDVSSYSIYVSFKVVDGLGLLDNDTSFIIWTTTPWTIPSNLAICLNKDLEYGLYQTNKGKFVFATALEKNLIKELEFENVQLIKTFKGSELEYIKTKHPFYDRESVVILGDHVTAESGTGCVHTAPGHGEDDFNVCQLYKIPPYCPVDEKGFYTEDVGEDLAFKFYEDGNEIVLEKLTKANALMKVSKFIHSYPHDWRTKKPLIYRATPQWFASIDKFRSLLLNEVHNVNWYPKWGELRMNNMIKDRSDWCISRQRNWGVPIPIIYNEDGSPIIEKDVFEHIAQLIGKHGSNVWYQLTAKELLPENYSNPKSPNNDFKKETDIMDVWFDSGSSSISVFEATYHKYPCDLYLEGFDQYRGWFNSSLIIGTAMRGKAPYKSVVSHGFVLDGQGRKMSKSAGNTVDPNQLINKYGADILRIWVASSDYQADLRISEDIIKQAAETYKNIRNRFKFMLGNLADFNPNKDQVDNFEFLDLAILNILSEVEKNCFAAYDNYDFSTVLTTIVNFLSIELSGFYLDMAKDILYCDSKNSLRRRQIQSTIYCIVDSLVKLLAPIIPHTCEEIYQKFVGKTLTSVHLSKFNKNIATIDSELIDNYRLLQGVRNDVLKALEEKRSEKLIGSSLDATIILAPKNKNVEQLLAKFDQRSLNQLFIVSKVILTTDKSLKEYENSYVNVEANNGIKCERCWNKVDPNEVVDGCLCHRCAQVLKEDYHE